MSRKRKFMDKLCKAMDKHGYRPAPKFITKLEQLPEKLFDKALDGALEGKLEEKKPEEKK